MKYIYSNVENGKLLHIINRISEISKKRQDLCSNKESLQVSCFELPLGKTFRPHKHIYVDKNTEITQESWIVARGSIKAILYDLDDSIISEEILNCGDCSITLHGGHNYECLEEGSLVYEYKTGPYLGQEKDKVFI